MTRRRMPIQGLAIFRIGAALALAVLFGGSVPTKASAGAFKCQDRFLDSIDESWNETIVTA
jgi:hypothetical protein